MLEKGNKISVKTVLYSRRQQQYSQSGGFSDYLTLAEYFQLEQITDYLSDSLFFLTSLLDV